ncbi:alkaline phosphatase PhoX [Polyangium mundeleinium]|uniref:DUF839 domain-containing protein n=1 Tax=Polyangium mundeleinium TaxID=2995306 RepID=A0ABT5ENX3_9BACT|nr:alkaline phosphatase PhoX [Polyangium mundeleinium]MDC0742617.1 DUF839 domain-containing protein [Polyangium mundeleinium]
MNKIPPRFSRRVVLRGGLAGLAAMMSPSLLASCSSEGGAPPPPATVGEPPFGGPPLDGPKLVSRIAEIGTLGDPDANGVKLPPGFSARIVAQTNKKPLESSDYIWHIAPDGGATFLLEDGGHVYVSNSEVPIAGGVGALRFDAAGKLVDAYPILSMTNINCAGGPTPWGTWLSCEEASRGRVFECDPRGEHEAIVRPALGIFKHEAAAIDRVKHHVYLTEDEGDGCFYRFVPDKLNRFGFSDLSSGKLQVAEVGMDGSVKWLDVPDPLFEGLTPTRKQVASATLFDGGEGIWFHQGIVYFSAKGEGRVYAYDTMTETLAVIYDAKEAENPILTGVDNITVSCCGDVLVAEDSGDMQIVAILPSGELLPLVQVMGHDKSEITGPAFDPSGTRLYFSSQRGDGSGGVTYEITGPFHAPA